MVRHREFPITLSCSRTYYMAFVLNAGYGASKGLIGLALHVVLVGKGWKDPDPYAPLPRPQTQHTTSSSPH